MSFFDNANIVDFLVMMIASDKKVQEELMLFPEMQFWKLKHKVLSMYGPVIFKEVRKIALMPWSELLETVPELIKSIDNKSEQEIKEGIESIQAEWLKLLPTPRRSKEN